MKLVIADKNASSWSMRPWLVLEHFGIPFEEILVRLDQPDTAECIQKYSPSSRVPCLVTDSGEAVWESLAIMETLAEQFPQHAMWPRDSAARAHARSISSEMHAGFMDVRQSMPMNIRLKAPGTGATPGALANVRRIEAIWTDCLKRNGGPFLFGDFSIADAMFAPVVMRFNTYAPELGPQARDYAARISALPVVAAWVAAAHAES